MDFRRKLMVRFALMALMALMALLALPSSARACSVGNDIIAMFPKEVGEFACADLKKARALPWFAKLKEQIVPERFRQFERFLASAGNDPNSQVDELAWGLVATFSGGASNAAGSVPTGEQVVGVALGNFNPDSAEQYFKSQKLPTFKSRGYTLYAYGSGASANDVFFFFIDSSTAAFGPRSLLEKMIEIRYGGDEGLLRNDRLFPLINEANGSGLVWLVLNPGYARLFIRQVVPAVEQFPDAQKLVNRMQSSILSFDSSGSGVDGHIQAICGSTEDANALGQVLPAALLYWRYQASQQNPELAQLLDQIRVSPAGDRVEVRMSLTDDQMTSLIRRNTFAIKM